MLVTETYIVCDCCRDRTWLNTVNNHPPHHVEQVALRKGWFALGLQGEERKHYCPDCIENRRVDCGQANEIHSVRD